MIPLFVHYSFSKGSHGGTGFSILQEIPPIKNYDDLKNIQKIIKENLIKNSDISGISSDDCSLIITNFKRLEVE